MSLDTTIEFSREFVEKYRDLVKSKGSPEDNWKKAMQGDGGVETYPATDLVSQTETCLNLLKELRAAIKNHVRQRGTLNSGRRLPNDLCFFVFGSLARMDFLRGSSDVDMMVLRKYSRVKDYRFVRKHQDFSSWTQDLKDDIRSPINTFLSSSIDGVSIYGDTTLRQKKVGGGKKTPHSERSITLGDLTQDIGTNLEPAWTDSRRAALLFESVGVWSSPGIDPEAFQQELISKTYNISIDISEKRFPIRGVILARRYMYSGLQAKAFTVANRRDKKIKNLELSKAVNTRLWTGTVTELTLVAMWLNSILADSVLSRDEVIIHLQRPPAEQLLHSIPGLIGRIEEELAGMFNSHDDRLLVYQFLDKFDEWPKLVVPLWYRYLQATNLYHEIRNGKDLNEKDLRAISKWTSELADASSVMNKLLRRIRSVYPNMMGGDKFYDMVFHDLHPGTTY